MTVGVQTLKCLLRLGAQSINQISLFSLTSLALNTCAHLSRTYLTIRLSYLKLINQTSLQPNSL